jgi:hypothetical protein
MARASPKGSGDPSNGVSEGNFNLSGPQGQGDGYSHSMVAGGFEEMS